MHIQSVVKVILFHHLIIQCCTKPSFWFLIIHTTFNFRSTDLFIHRKENLLTPGLRGVLIAS